MKSRRISYIVEHYDTFHFEYYQAEEPYTPAKLAQRKTREARHPNPAIFTPEMTKEQFRYAAIEALLSAVGYTPDDGFLSQETAGGQWRVIFNPTDEDMLACGFKEAPPAPGEILS